MKNIFIFTLTLLISLSGFSQIDRSKAPKAGPAPVIQLGNYETFTLDNGLKVFVVENHKTPRVSWQLFIDHSPVLEGDHAGMQSIMGSLLMSGTTTKTKTEIDESIDFIGASLSTSPYGGYASSLTKHKETVLSLLSDIILNPTFPQEELDKLKKQTISNIMSNSTDPGAISSNVSAVLNYGTDHPYGEVETTESVETITTEMCKNFYSTYFKPNVSYLIVVGDISKKEAEGLVKSKLGSWAKGDVPTHEYKTPQPPAATQVAFVDKPGAVQSTIHIGYPVELKPGSEDAIAASVMNAILGNSGFMARLIQNIREDKAYTYGAYSNLSTDAIIGDFYAGAEVRNDVTDSAVVEFLFEMDRLTKEKVGDEELQNVKNYLNGRFARSLERPQTVARFALNTARYNLSPDYYATYLEKLQAVTAEDVMNAAKKYLLTNRANILIVGNKGEVANSLKKFSKSGKVNYYDAFGNPVSDAEPIPEGVSVTTVIDNYLTAIGGKEKLAAITTRDMVMTSSMQGMPLELRITSSGTDKYAMSMTSGDMKLQNVVVNGSKGKMSGMMGAKDLTAEEIAEYTGEITIFDELKFNSENCELIQIEEFNGVRSYKVIHKNSKGQESTHYYSVETGLKVGEVITQDTPQGPMTSTTTYTDYKDVDGIKVAYTTVTNNAGQVMELKIKSIKLGTKIPASTFAL